MALGSCIAAAAVACDGKSTSNSATDCPGYSRIVSGGFSRTGHHLTWTFELESMPTELVLNRAAVPDNMIDYGWQINVDANTDGQYECYMSIAHFKDPGAAETRTSDILGSTEHNIWKLSGDTVTSLGTFAAGIAGSAFTFDVDDTTVADYSSVTSASQSSWDLAYRYGGISEVCTDKWP